VQDAVAHVVGLEERLLTWVPSAEPVFTADTLGNFITDHRGLTPRAARERFDRVIGSRRAQVAALAAADLDVRCWTPVGAGTVARFLRLRVFDTWVHEQDVRVPLGRPGHTTGAAAEIALDEVRTSFGYIAGRKVAVPDGAAVAVHLTGPLAATICAEVVDGRARLVDTLHAPDASITTDSLTFMLLACGRIDPQQPLADGRVQTSGDPDLAHRLATQLRFTF
jgi:uncharacterized protein (TIGR03083 family)